jgi:hypothetical protein
MRYLVGFVFVLALVASPLSVSAQAEKEGATSEPNVEEPTALSEASAEEGGLSPRQRRRTRDKWTRIPTIFLRLSQHPTVAVLFAASPHAYPSNDARPPLGVRAAGFTF